jgi:hypothetical protein
MNRSQVFCASLLVSQILQTQTCREHVSVFQKLTVLQKGWRSNLQTLMASAKDNDLGSNHKKKEITIRKQEVTNMIVSHDPLF